MTSPQGPEPGWYIDPAAPAHERFWDGQMWTEHQRHRSGTTSTSAAPPPTSSGGFKVFWLGLTDAARGWIVIGIIGVLIAVVIAVVVIQNSSDSQGFKDCVQYAQDNKLGSQREIEDYCKTAEKLDLN